MATEAHPVDVRRIMPVNEPDVTGFRSDYTDAFEVSPSSLDSRSAEQWSRSRLRRCAPADPLVPADGVASCPRSASGSAEDVRPRPRLAHRFPPT